MHDQRGPLLEPQVSDEVWSEQDAQKSYTENRVRMVVVDSDELATEPHVFKSKIFQNRL